MPTAVTHVLLAIISVDLFRDYIFKHKHLINLKMVLLAGVFGLLPDIDIPLFWLMRFVGIQVTWFHRLFTHSLIFPLILVVLAIAFRTRHRLSTILSLAAFGWALHIVLDTLLTGTTAPFWPISGMQLGLGLIDRIGYPALMEGIDAILLLGWLWHEEMKHKISDFI